MVVMMCSFFTNHALNMAKFFNMTRNINWTFVIKSIFFRCFIQQLQEQGMVDITDRDNKPMLLFSLTYHNCKTPFWYIFQFFLPMMIMMKVNVRHMKMKIQMKMVFISATHLCTKQDPTNKKQEKRNLKKDCTVEREREREVTRKVKERKAKDQKRRWLI